MSTIIGSKFKNLCFVGLNKVEYFPEQSEESIFADSWQDVIDEQSRKKVGLFFFAPRDLEGEPVDPYEFLATNDTYDEQEIALSQNMLNSIPMVDLCRLKSSSPNTVNILVVADIIFHWDVNDSYIQPTTPTSWERDIKQIIKGYPRSSEKHIYTNWNSFKLDGSGIDIRPIKDLELYEESWLNKPTYQQKHGTSMLALSIIFAGLAYSGLYVQSQELEDLSNKIRKVTASTPKGQNFNKLSKSVSEQQSFMRYKGLIPFITKDIANAIQLSGMEISELKIEPFNVQKPPKHMLVTVKAKKEIYSGWLEEEPISKALLGQSVTLDAIRRPPGNTFALEGVIDLADLESEVKEFNKKQNIKIGEIEKLPKSESAQKQSVDTTSTTEDGGSVQ